MRNDVWDIYAIELIHKNKVNNFYADLILNKVDLYIDYCMYNKRKIRRERIDLIVNYEIYKFNGFIPKNIPKNNQKIIREFLNLIFPDEKHIYREFLKLSNRL